jgi:hypothetical protein
MMDFKDIQSCFTTRILAMEMGLKEEKNTGRKKLTCARVLAQGRF